MNNHSNSKPSKTKLVKVWLIASLAAFLLASISHSQFVLFELTKLDITISLSQWLSHTASDIIGLALGYGSVIAIAFLLAFSIMAKLNSWIKLPPQLIYTVAGGLAIATALLAMQPLLHITLIAGARSAAGFLFQIMAGCCGGWLFATLLIGQTSHKDS